MNELFHTTDSVFGLSSVHKELPRFRKGVSDLRQMQFLSKSKKGEGSKIL